MFANQTTAHPIVSRQPRRRDWLRARLYGSIGAAGLALIFAATPNDVSAQGAGAGVSETMRQAYQGGTAGPPPGYGSGSDSSSGSSSPAVSPSGGPSSGSGYPGGSSSSGYPGSSSSSGYPGGSSSGSGYPGGSSSGYPGSSGSGYPGGSSSGYPGSSGSGYPGSGYPGGGGRSGGRGNQGFAQALMQQLISKTVASTDVASLTSPDAAPPIPSGPVLMNESTVAYTKGASALARDLYFGHIVAEFENAQPQMSAVKYSAVLKRPVWQIRWGISMSVRGDATDPQPLSDTPSRANGAPGGPGSQDPSMMAAGYGAPGGTGDQSGGYSQDDMREQMEAQNAAQQDMANMYNSGYSSGSGGPGGPGAPGGPGGQNALDIAPKAQSAGERLASMERQMLDEQAASELEDNLGAVVDYIGEQFDQRYAEGAFGRAFTDVSDGAGQAEAVSNSFVDLLESAESDLPLWRPGIVYVGKGNSAQSIASAKDAGLDLLIHVDVLLKPLRGEFTQNISRLRLYHVASGKSFGSSPAIDTLEFNQKSRTKGLGSREYIEEQLSAFMGIIDRQTKTIDLPRLTPAVAEKRIGALLASGGGRNLHTLAEVRLFQQQGLLNEDQVLQVFDIVGGEEGMQILFGTEDEKLTVVRNWIADKYRSSSSDN